ncbi:hypothetical protein [Clavibacter californiensis]|uniref:Uncharacterized protein n=1 Tax=Clavibacter californiensis TaxID=1401995 RepID=A0ABX9N9I2_9MICO|nr:hypothetical protein [Clavibacter californiensis]RII94846.1 hypothetical protein DZF98_00025 [Clavibacter californiensis]UKF81672.1 hypothetical protein FGD68_15380 [Clavibacter californiensis]
MSIFGLPTAIVVIVIAIICVIGTILCIRQGSIEGGLGALILLVAAVFFGGWGYIAIDALVNGYPGP